MFSAEMIFFLRDDAITHCRGSVSHRLYDWRGGWEMRQTEKVVWQAQ